MPVQFNWLGMKFRMASMFDVVDPLVDGCRPILSVDLDRASEQVSKESKVSCRMRVASVLVILAVTWLLHMRRC